MKTTCPHCETEFDVQRQWAGTTMACPFCRESLTVPAAPTETLTDFLEDDAPKEAASKTKTCPMCGATNRFSAGECKACGEPLTPFSQSTKGRVFRDGKLLVMTKDAELPYRCIKTNGEADNLLRRTLYWHQPWVYIFIISPLIYIIVALIARQSANIKIPLCRRSRRKRLFAILAAWLCFFGMFGLLIFGISLSDSRYWGDAGLIVGFGGFFAALIGLFVSLAIANVVTPAKINKSHLWIKGAHPDYLAALPEWDDE